MRPSGAWKTSPVSRRTDDVLEGLKRAGQKEIPARYLYDTLGSALFEAITLLPEYGLTRADLRLIARNAWELAERDQPSLVVELGSGGGGKARQILEALAQRNPVRYCPVDVSHSALDACRLAFLDVPNLKVLPIEAAYIAGLKSALQEREPARPVLVLFLGSSIGNFDPEAAINFLVEIRGLLMRGDLLLFSADLEKDVPRMLAAYDDSLGVTAAFNLNVLARLNREMSASFDLALFEHLVRYDKERRRIEMHLRSKVDQTVSIDATEVAFRKGETVRSECSYKFRLADVRRLWEAAGFRLENQWIDWEWPLAQTLLRAP